MAEEETHGTPLVPEGMTDPDPAELVLPTNADLVDEESSGDNPDEPTTGEEVDAGGGDDTTDEAPEAQGEVQYETVADPGDFSPGDYSFKVTTYDEEGKNPKVHKITDLTAWDTLLETEPNFGTSAAVLRAERNAQKMDRGIERDKARYDAAKTEYDEAVRSQEEMKARTLQWQNELDYLVGKGELPPMPKEFHVAKADWNDPAVAGQPAVKAQMELLNYFRKENDARAKAGLAPMASLLDAYNGFARERDKETTKQAKATVAAQRTAAAGKVAGSAPRPATAAPRGIAVGRTGVLN